MSILNEPIKEPQLPPLPAEPETVAPVEVDAYVDAEVSLGSKGFLQIHALLAAKNAAANGRVFCLALLAIALTAYFKTGMPAFFGLAVFSAIPIGLSSIADGNAKLRPYLVVPIYGLPVLVTLFMLYLSGK